MSETPPTRPSLLRFACKLVAALLITFLAAGSHARAQPAFADLVVFGDSLSDTGNLSDRLGGTFPGPDYYQGRFSNGPVWVEHLGTGLGLDAPVASRTSPTGRNYAYGGAETGAGFTSLIVPNLGPQITDYLDEASPIGDELFIVFGGANNFINGQTNPAVPVNDLVNHITTLAADGAGDFLVPNLPPLGQTPRFNGTADEASMDALAADFNAILASELASLRTSLGLTIHELDVFSLFQQVLTDPASFGFTNVTGEAIDQPAGSIDADQWLFWDDLHPTTAGHGLLADAALTALSPPLPGDADGDGDVDAFDLTAVNQNFGSAQALAGSPGDAAGTVPEPTTAALLALAATALLRRRGARQSARVATPPLLRGHLNLK